MHKVVTKRLRDTMASIDVTQPQWWTLTRVDAGDGLRREDVATQLADVADSPDEVPRAIDQLLHRGWIDSDEMGQLHLTDAGRAAQSRIRDLVVGLRAQVHKGISDEEYVAALKVMRRMISNVGSAAD